MKNIWACSPRETGKEKKNPLVSQTAYAQTISNSQWNSLWKMLKKFSRIFYKPNVKFSDPHPVWDVSEFCL